jgi:hypothetical protein
MRTYQPTMVGLESGIMLACARPEDDDNIRALDRWMNQSARDTVYGASLYTRLAASAETQGKIALAENYLIDAYKLCRKAELTTKSADLAERLYILLFDKGSADTTNKRKALAWKKLAESLRSESFGII